MPTEKMEIWFCPYCNTKNTIPQGIGVNVVCSHCGKPWYTDGMDVMDKDSLKLYREITKENKRIFESKKDEG